MLEQLNGCLLNQVANGILFLVLIAVYFNTLSDRRFGRHSRDRNFSMFILFGAVYVGLHVVWLTMVDVGAAPLVVFVVRLLRIVSAFIAYCFIGLWLLSIVRESDAMSQRSARVIEAVTLGLFLLSELLFVVTRNNLVANIPIFGFYLLLEGLVVRYRKVLGKNFVVSMTMLIVPTLALQAQEWWNYTPANVYLVIVILVIYNRMWIEQKQRYLDTQRMAAEQRADLENARTKLVLSQIKPHFLYNTLGTIAYLCNESPQEAEKLTLDLSTYLRGNLSALDDGRVVPFWKELEHVRTFLGIEKVRFEDTLEVVYDIKVGDFMVPTLTVEPLVENAVKHGVCKKPNGGVVTISTHEEDDCYVVTVADDGVGFDVGLLDEDQSDHVGIRSVRSRVELLSGGSLFLESSPGEGTVASIRIPKKQSEK